MRLARLAALERKKIEEEYKEVRQEIRYLEGLLAAPAKILEVIRSELAELKKRYGDPRRTMIITDAEYNGSVVQAENLVPDGEVLVTISSKGEVQRIMNTARPPRSGRAYTQVLVANNRNELLLISKSGRVWRAAIHRLPEKTGQGLGESLTHLLTGWERNEEVASALDVPIDETLLAQNFLLAITRNGRVVRVSAAEVKNLHSGASLVNLEANDEVLWATLTRGDDQLLLVSAQGQGILFAESDVRPTGIGVQGVWGMKLEEKNDAVVGAGLAHAGSDLLVISQTGMHKRVPLAEYPVQGRYGKGVRTMNLDPKSGPLAAAAVVAEQDQATVLTNKRHSVDLSVRHVVQVDRYHQGHKLDLPENQHVVALLKWGGQSGPEAGAGIESASEANTTAAQGGPSLKEKVEKKKAANRVSTIQEGSDEKSQPSKEHNGQQLSLDFTDSSKNSDNPNGRSGSKGGTRDKKR
ncbi:MAG: hypothetical protein H0T73_05740, partial [Ardenticatenales bacterium]|nr:hypothetical protein [Ardenticatenales bacterium]